MKKEVEVTKRLAAKICGGEGRLQMMERVVREHKPGTHLAEVGGAKLTKRSGRYCLSCPEKMLPRILTIVNGKQYNPDEALRSSLEVLGKAYEVKKERR